MKGADALFRTLSGAGVKACFTNPGTSEMHMVAALDRLPEIRPVLCLFEGVVTGAADGYFRMTGQPAATLLHLGPGLANGLANLHNARKAKSAILNVVGEHASVHLAYDAPLTSDIAGIARPVSDAVLRVEHADEMAAIALQAIERAHAGEIATLVVTADATWSDTDVEPEQRVEPKAEEAPPVDAGDLAEALSMLQTYGERALLLLGGTALLDDAPKLAAGLAETLGCRVAAQSLSARMDRGGDRPPLERIPFEINAALKYLEGVECVVMIGAPLPVSFFAYPGKPSVLIPDNCETLDLVPRGDPYATLVAVAEAAGAGPVVAAPASPPAVREGRLDASGIGAAIAAALPDDTVVIDESITAAPAIFSATRHAAPHAWMNNMGGAIGFALPLSIGVAIGAPGRRVLAMIGDGSALYTEQGLWTLARENLDVTVLVLANRAYAVLRNEWARMGAGAEGRGARDMLMLDRPTLDFVALAQGHGVDGLCVDTAQALYAALTASFAKPGPCLIEALF